MKMEKGPFSESILSLSHTSASTMTNENGEKDVELALQTLATRVPSVSGICEIRSNHSNQANERGRSMAHALFRQTLKIFSLCLSHFQSPDYNRVVRSQGLHTVSRSQASHQHQSPSWSLSVFVPEYLSVYVQ